MEASRSKEGSLELNIPHSASIALVSASAVLCIIAVFIYCICIYCRKSDSDKVDQPPTTHVSLPMSSYNKKMNVGGEGCVICLNEFEDGEGVKVIPGCGHVFHSQCIDIWLAKHVSCPVCRCEKMSSAVEDEVEAGNEGERFGAIEVKVMA